MDDRNVAAADLVAVQGQTGRRHITEAIGFGREQVAGSMANRKNWGILHNGQLLGRFPMNRIRQVDEPTNTITDGIQRIDLREIAYDLARRGDFGPAVQKGVQNNLPAKYPLSAAQKDVIDYLAEIESHPTAEELAPIPHDPEVLTRHIKAVAYFLKADVVGACEIPESAYYSHDKEGSPIEPRFKNAIIMVMGKEPGGVRASTGSDWLGDPLSFQAYQHLGLVTETIANYISRLGWEASPQYGPSFVNKYSVLLPPLLIRAGIGEVSRAGIILNPYLGLGYKASAVLTNMPIVTDKPIEFGVQRFCQDCKLCAENCPSNAIPIGDKVMYNGYETWKLDVRRCASFNFTNRDGTMCNRCVKSCPWTYPHTWPHNLVRELVLRSGLAQRVAIKAADYMRTGENHPDEKWWFDLEYVNGQIMSRE